MPVAMPGWEKAYLFKKVWTWSMSVLKGFRCLHGRQRGKGALCILPTALDGQRGQLSDAYTSIGWVEEGRVRKANARSSGV